MRILSYITVAGILATVLVSCTEWQETRRGVRFGRTRLEVVDTNIIRVVSYPGLFPKGRNLASWFSYPSEKCWTVTESGTGIVLATSSVQAVIEKSSGRVSFGDAEGNPLLVEDARLLEGELRQQWHKNEEETFFGFNCAGARNSFPFVASDRNYGIFWDNPSVASWGKPLERFHLNELFRVFDITGAEGGLTGTYLYEEDGVLTKFVRSEPFLYFNDDASVLEFKPDVPLQNSKITFEGDLEPASDGLYGFELRFTGSVNVSIGREMVVADKRRSYESPAEMSFNCRMRAGEKTHICIDWEPGTKLSYCSLMALPPALADEAVNSFRSPDGRQVDYYFIYGAGPDVLANGLVTLVGRDSCRFDGLYSYPVTVSDSRGVSMRSENLFSVEMAEGSGVMEARIDGGADVSFTLYDELPDGRVRAAAGLLYDDSSKVVSTIPDEETYYGFNGGRRVNVGVADTSGVKSYEFIL